MKKFDKYPELKPYKWQFEDGEKKLYSGCMNQWVKMVEREGFTYLYKQKVRYRFSSIPESVIYTLTDVQKKQYCLENGLYELPFDAYNQVITAWSLSIVNSPVPVDGKYVHKKQISLYMLSCDDDIFGARVEYSEEQLEFVKKIIHEKAMDDSIFYWNLAEALESHGWEITSN